MAEDDAERNHASTGHNIGNGEAEKSLPQLKAAAMKEEKYDDPQAQPPEADEFGLPVKPPRRRNWSLDEMESPEKAVPTGLPGVQEAKNGGPVIGDVEETEKGKERAVDARADTRADTDGPSGSARSAPAQDAAPPSPKSPTLPTSSPVSSAQHKRNASNPVSSEWSHQQMVPQQVGSPEPEDEGEWQEMPAIAEHRIYDDWGKVLAKSYDEVQDDQAYGYGNLGGAGKGYTRVQMDEDAQSATSMDDNTAYLFKQNDYARNALDADDEEGRDLQSQMQTTKELLTEGQKIAYVGIVRLAILGMVNETDALAKTKGSKKVIELATEALKMWGQKCMMRLFQHMEIEAAEQIMVEQLAEHGVQVADLAEGLMQHAKLKKSEKDVERTSEVASPRPSSTSNVSRASAPDPSTSSRPTTGVGTSQKSTSPAPSPALEAPPAYTEQAADDFHIEDGSQLDAKNVDLDIRWTVLCDLFLLLIADSSYDARSRTLLERVGAALSVPWQEIVRFEKRVTEALEMQEAAEKENWNEEEHLASREKRARNKRLMVMGLCTVGGGLIIGLSAGALAPVIGAGLAAGFTGIGVAGTGTFLGGTGAAALIGTTGTLIGGHIGLKGSGRRTGAVKTFEYKPLFNNKRANLIVTVSGWMTGKVDDVRLPFSTVSPIMGDIYSVNWEPDMLQSTGQTIQILGTEALTQTIQQILGATFLATLMAGLSLPIVLTKLAYLIDNPWTVSCARADATGLILADSLIDRNLGERPITLVGFSLGSRVIFSCLRELSRRGAVGLVQNVYLFGSPVVVKQDEWTRAKAMVSGRFVNGYATNDWILAYLFRATGGGVMRVAGLATVDIPGIENINVTDEVPGHMAYRGMMPTLLQLVGWEVESEEFTEIEDPDPEDHARRQRELISEIEEARKELEEGEAKGQTTEKKGFRAFFSRKKAPARKAWETYDEAAGKEQNAKARVLAGEAEAEKVAEENSNVMFDVDAIRREALQLALNGENVDEIKAHMQIREIESTMPALRIESPVMSSSSGTLQRAKTHDGTNGRGTPSKLSQDGSRCDGDDEGDVNTRHDESKITMSFDSPTDERHPAATNNGNGSNAYLHANGTVSRQGSPNSSEQHGKWEDLCAHRDGSAVDERPPLRSAHATLVGPSVAQGSGHGKISNPDFNPWGGEEFGREKGVEMSFE